MTVVIAARPGPSQSRPAAAPRVVRDRLAPGERLNILLLDGQQRQTLACARTLGRRGLRVGVTACGEDEHSASALRSRWCDVGAITPDVSGGPKEFVASLLNLLDAHPADVLLPAHDGSIEAIRAFRTELESRTALALAPEAALALAVDKQATLRIAREAGIRIPRSIHIRVDAELAPALREAGLPAMLKPVRSWADGEAGGMRLTSSVVLSTAEAEAAWAYMRDAGAEAQLQEWVPGRRDAVSLLFAQGQFWASFAQTSHREFPVHGGVSVLCESIEPSDDVVRPAQELVRAMGLEGPSMVEFRRDADGEPVLMEVNPRLGGSLALAERCGVDLAGMTFEWASGRPLTAIGQYAVGKRLRWLTGDVWNLKCAFDSAGPDVPPRLSAVARFFGDFALRPAAIDGFDARDLSPVLVDWRHQVLAPIGGRIRRFGRSRAAASKSRG